jgi:hypothetical protein
MNKLEKIKEILLKEQENSLVNKLLNIINDDIDTPEKWFRSILDNIYLKDTKKNIRYYYTDDKFIVYQDIKNKEFIISYHNVYVVLRDKFNIKSQEYKELCNPILEEYMNCKGYTTADIINILSF